jgi:hypothetical protein
MLEKRVHRATQDAYHAIDNASPRQNIIPFQKHQDCVGNTTKEAVITVQTLEDAAYIYGRLPR